MKSDSVFENLLCFLIEYLCVCVIVPTFPVLLILNGSGFLGWPLLLAMYGGGGYLAACHMEIFKIVMAVYAVVILALYVKRIVDIREFERLVSEVSDGISGSNRNRCSGLGPSWKKRNGSMGGIDIDNVYKSKNRTGYEYSERTTGKKYDRYSDRYSYRSQSSSSYRKSSNSYYGTGGNTNYRTGSNTNYRTGSGSGNTNRNRFGQSPKKNLFFSGMKAREAKKEYIRLAKKYHPDNRGGDAEMFKRVNNAYEEYKKNQEN